MATGNRQTYFNQINVTPLTDVFLVLLVVMMLVIPLADRGVLKVSAPVKGVHSSVDKDRILRADVSENGEVKLNGKPISPVACAPIQKAIEGEQRRLGTKELQIEISSDEYAKQKDVVAIMDAALGAGIKSVSMLSVKDRAD